MTSGTAHLGSPLLCTLFFLAGTPLLPAATAATAVSRHHWMNAFHKSDTSGPKWHEDQGKKHFRFLNIGNIYGELRRASPDGRYEAVILTTDGEVGYVYVFRRHPGSRYPRRVDLMSRQVVDVGGCVWVPGHGHWLAVSAGGADYGPGLLALWDRPYHFRALRRRLPFGQGYDIRMASLDGQLLRYNYHADSVTPGLLLSLPRY